MLINVVLKMVKKEEDELFFLNFLSSRFLFLVPLRILFFGFSPSNFLTQHRGPTHKHNLPRHMSPRQPSLDTYVFL